MDRHHQHAGPPNSVLVLDVARRGIALHEGISALGTQSHLREDAALKRDLNEGVHTAIAGVEAFA